MKFRDWLLGLVDRRPRVKETRARSRGPALHVIILDGTMSSLRPGRETNAGRTFKLIREGGLRANQTVYYEAGIQWRDWKSTPDVLMGRGINRQIERAYGVLCSRYRPGDRIVLVGYSRGAYAVRSLAGIVDNVGLLQTRHATVRNVRQAYRHYRAPAPTGAAADFRAIYCHESAEVEAVAVWDTVKSLGVRLPLIWKLAEAKHEFHNHALGPHVRHGFHALGLDETRDAFAPILWQTPEGYTGRVEQVWFRGNHGDVGGQLDGFEAARPLANIPLVWMLDRLESCGVALPPCWRDRFHCDARAPSVSTWRGWAKIFLLRHRRRPGLDRSERLHDTVGHHPLWPQAAPDPVAGPGLRPELNQGALN